MSFIFFSWLFIDLSIYPSIYASICSFICPSISPPSIHSASHPSIYISFQSSIHSSTHPSTSIYPSSMDPPIHLFVSPSLILPFVPGRNNSPSKYGIVVMSADTPVTCLVHSDPGCIMHILCNLGQVSMASFPPL